MAGNLVFNFIPAFSHMEKKPLQAETFSRSKAKDKNILLHVT